MLERAVQGEEAQIVRSVQGAEKPPEHKERQRSHSDEWLTFRFFTTTPPTQEADLEPLDYELDLSKEVTICFLDTQCLESDLLVLRFKANKPTLVLSFLWEEAVDFKRTHTLVEQVLLHSEITRCTD